MTFSKRNKPSYLQKTGWSLERIALLASQLIGKLDIFFCPIGRGSPSPQFLTINI
jgi:hypothetical protein